MGMRRVWASSALVVALAACGPSTALEGIYELSSWTNNPSDCAAPGSPAFEEGLYSHFFVRGDRFFGTFFINAVMCEGLDACRANASDRDTLFIGDFLFDEEGDDGDWVGARGSLSNDGARCSGRLRLARITGEPGASVLISEESKTVSDIPVDSREECDFDAARVGAASHPCESLTLVTGAFLEGL
jgi:hypothetical protein